MLTDIFANRYKVTLWPNFTENERVFLVQAFRIIAEQIYPYESASSTNTWQRLNSILSMELGKENLSPLMSTYFLNKIPQMFTHSIKDVCKNFVLLKYDGSIPADRFMKERVSFIELAFRQRQDEIKKANEDLPHTIVKILENASMPRSGIRIPVVANEKFLRESNKKMNDSFSSCVNEINARMSQAGYHLHYHSGLIQRSADDITHVEVEQPFWSIMSDPIWSSVDIDIKEAIDRRDNNGRDPSLYAAKALESTIKIISDRNGWTTKNERGAHNYIDNLRSSRNGAFIKEWEAKSLKNFFSDIRNPIGHGSGSEKIVHFSTWETDWVVAFCMIWIRSLIRRM